MEICERVLSFSIWKMRRGERQVAVEDVPLAAELVLAARLPDRAIAGRSSALSVSSDGLNDVPYEDVVRLHVGRLEDQRRRERSCSRWSGSPWAAG